MVKSKVVLLSVYFAIVALVMVFIFGESGILDNITQSQEIVKLTEALSISQLEIDEMIAEYYRLSGMKIPNQAFLINQGRKSQDIVVYKMKSPSSSLSDNFSIEKEKKLFFMIGSIALIILLLGCIAVVIIGKTKEEVRDESV
ncbi:MAG: hypothetical protein ACRCWI_01905 [Brevinema sp.]